MGPGFYLRRVENSYGALGQSPREAREEFFLDHPPKYQAPVGMRPVPTTSRRSTHTRSLAPGHQLDDRHLGQGGPFSSDMPAHRTIAAALRHLIQKEKIIWAEGILQELDVDPWLQC
jgi:hypothetical protein